MTVIVHGSRRTAEMQVAEDQVRRAIRVATSLGMSRVKVKTIADDELRRIAARSTTRPLPTAAPMESGC